MFEQFRNYVGYGRLLCYKNRDQGDTAQLEGIYISLNGMMGNDDIITKKSLAERYEATMKQLEVAPGIYRRCSNPDHWGSNPNNFTRDNRGQLEIAMAVMGDTKRLTESRNYILKRCGFHQNTKHGTDDPENKTKIPDFMSPGQEAVYVRALGGNISRLALYVLDLGLLADLYFRKNDRTYDNMLANQILFANKYKPTFISKLALKLYKKTDFLEKIDAYYLEDADHNGLTPMAKLYRAAYEKLT